MFETSLLILYVDDAAASARFYRDLFEREPIEASPNFAMFALSPALRLGLWSRRGVVPAAVATVNGGSELALIVPDVDALHADWSQRGVTIVLPPTDLDFGRSFVALDPDGHRLRLYRLRAE